MKTDVLIRLVVFLLASAIAGRSEEPPAKQRNAFPKWAFCVAYQFRDADERDARPVDPNGEKNPFDDGNTWIPHALLNGRSIIDVASLSTRAIKSGTLKHEVAEQVIRGATQGAKEHPVKECYEPHHVFVFYSYEGQPVAAIEVCFSCNRVRMSPEVLERATGSFETADLAALAKIASATGLSLSPFVSLEEYLRRLNATDDRVKRAAEQAAPLNGP
jgi:hypothetical protein